jgi:tetratricopeptide (TPR) repeat protein
MRRLVFLSSLVPLLALAGPPDPQVELGFQHFYNLEYDQAIAVFSRVTAANPTDPAAFNFLAQSILFQAMFVNGALESDLISATDPFVTRPKLPVTEQQKKGFETAIQKALDLSQSRLAANPRDTRAMYTLGVAMGLRANWNYLVHKAWLDPLRDATQARKLHNQATDIDPNFTDARMVQGVHDYILASLPFAIKMLGMFTGFRGDREEGMRTIRTVYEKGSVNRSDAAVLLAAILRREKRQSEAVPLLEDVTSRYPRNYLFRYELALLYADLGDRGKVLKQLEVIDGMKGKVAIAPERVEYMRGAALLQLRDVDGAIVALAKATARSGQLDTTSASQAWLRYGQALDIKGRRAEAIAAYRRAIEVGPQTASAKEAKDYVGYRYKLKHT